MKITNKKENIEHVSKLKTIDKTTLGTEKEIRTSLFEHREISNLLLSPFSNHHWKVLYTNVDSNVSFICNSSTGIHHERCTVLGYLKLAEPNSVFILKNKSVLSDNVFLYTPFIKITNEHFNLEHLASVERDIHKKVVEEYFKGYVLDYADIAKLSRKNPYYLLIKDFYPDKKELVLPYAYKISILNPLSTSEFKLPQENYLEVLNFHLAFCNSYLKNATISAESRVQYLKYYNHLEKIKNSVTN